MRRKYLNAFGNTRKEFMRTWRRRKETLGIFSLYAKRYKSVYISVNNNTNLNLIKILSNYIIWDRLSQKTISQGTIWNREYCKCGTYAGNWRQFLKKGLRIRMDPRINFGSWIRIRIRVKSWIRIRIKVKISKLSWLKIEPWRAAIAHNRSLEGL
jgi:hypothetical protein